MPVPNMLVKTFHFYDYGIVKHLTNGSNAKKCWKDNIFKKKNFKKPSFVLVT